MADGSSGSLELTDSFSSAAQSGRDQHDDVSLDGSSQQSLLSWPASARRRPPAARSHPASQIPKRVSHSNNPAPAKLVHDAADSSESFLSESGSSMRHSQLQNMARAGLTSTPKPAVVSSLDRNLLEMTKQELEIANQEKEMMRNMLEQVQAENAALHTDIKTKTLELEQTEAEHSRTREHLAKLEQEAEKYLIKQERSSQAVTSSAQQSELEKLVDDLSCCRTELKAAKASLGEKQNLVSQLKDALRDSEVSCEQYKSESRREASHASEGKRHLGDTSQRLQRAEKLLRVAEEDIAALNVNVAQLKRSREKYVEREFNAMQQLRECLQSADLAVLQKEEAIQKGQQAERDNECLLAEKAKLLTEMANRVKTEVDASTSELQTKITQLLAELNKQQDEICEKHATLERFQRERRSLETELEKARRRPEPLISEQTLADLRQRVSAAEYSRDDARTHAGQLEHSVKQLEDSLAHHTSTSVRQIEDLRKDLARADQDVDKLRTTEMSLCKENAGLQQQLKSAEDDRQATEDQWMLKLAAANHRLEMRDQECTAQLRNAEERQYRAVNELRDMLTAQQRFGNKWRLQAQAVAEKLDHALKEARDSAQQHKQEKHRHDANLKQTRSAISRGEDRIRVLVGQCEQLADEVQHSQQAADTSASQVQTLLSRERLLTEDKRRLQTELYRLQMEVERLGSRPGRYSNAVRLASTVQPGAAGRAIWPLDAGNMPALSSTAPSGNGLPMHSTQDRPMKSRSKQRNAQSPVMMSSSHHQAARQGTAGMTLSSAHHGTAAVPSEDNDFDDASASSGQLRVEALH